MSVDKQSLVPVVSQVLTALPLKEVFAAPLVAAIEAHNSACSALEQFIERVGRNPKTGEITTLQFRYSQQSGSGEPAQRSIEVPLIAMLPLPAFAVDRLSVDFEVKIDAGEAAADSSSKELGGELALGYGPVALKLKGSVASKSEQTRKSDTSARYTVHLEASRQPMPEAFQRVVEALIAEVLPRHTASGTAAATSPAASIPNPAASLS
jgi:hypothetical protein